VQPDRAESSGDDSARNIARGRAVQIHVKVEIWSDVVCPWCFIGKRRFEQAVAAFPHPVEVVYSEVCGPEGCD